MGIQDMVEQDMEDHDTEDHGTEDHDMKGQNIVGRLRRTMQQFVHTEPMPLISSDTLLLSNTRNLSRVKLLFHSYPDGRPTTPGPAHSGLSLSLHEQNHPPFLAFFLT